jgi:prepilin-type N-terminal cleavage/methylation domain-containing protein
VAEGRVRVPREQDRAYSLLEFILVLAVVAILAAALAPSFIKHLDRLADEEEAAALRALADGFKQSVSTRKYVPDANGWATNVAAQLGMQLGDVTANARRQPRIFLIDPEMQIGVNASPPNLPYTQPVTGSRVTDGSGLIVAPINPRFLLLSSISTPLPIGLASGVGATTGPYTFSNLWNTAEGAVPAGWTWSGGDDLKIQRIDLSDLFLQLILNNRDVTNTAYYAIDNAATNSVPYNGLPTMYFIRTSDLKLLNTGGLMEYSEILQFAGSFTFELGTWQAGNFLGRGVGEPGPLDLQRAMNLFLRAQTNQYAQGGAAQTGVYDQMIRYMSNYIVWRDAGYPGQFSGGGTPPAELNDAQRDLARITIDLINPR